MKNLFILLITIFITETIIAQTPFCEDFESYVAGDNIAEISSNWNSWAELMTGAVAPFLDDARVSNMQAYSGSNSLFFLESTGSGGPQDIVLMFDTTQNITQSTLGSLSLVILSLLNLTLLSKYFSRLRFKIVLEISHAIKELENLTKFLPT